MGLPARSASLCSHAEPVRLLDLTHTSHTRARTGIQKVCRALNQALAAHGDVTPICHDPFRSAWRVLEPWEQENLDSVAPAAGRGARWPLGARLRGRFARLTGQGAAPLPSSTGLIVPEIFSPATARALPALLASVHGPRVALFHDAIALKYPELSPPGTVARFPNYLRELLAFDGIAAVSEDSRDALIDYWQWLGIHTPPPVQAIPLGIDSDPINPAGPLPSASGLPVVLSVGTLEARKNHLALLEACEALWNEGLAFELHLIGMAQAQTGKRAVEQVRSLQATGYKLRYDGPVSDTALYEAYQRATFTVYPSLMEGFGLPVLESLRHGRPCICSRSGALGESARGGGCLGLDAVTPQDLANGIRQLLTSEAKLAELKESARHRRFKTWADYTGEILTWMDTLPSRP